MASEFGVLPSQAARDLESDPSQLSLVCLELLEYGRAKAVFDTRNKKAMKAYGGQRMLKRVEDVAHELAEEETAPEPTDQDIIAQNGTSQALPTQAEGDQ